MKTKTKIIKTKFSSGDFRIFSCCAIGAHDIQTNKFGMFSIKGNYGYLTEGQEYDLYLSLLESNQWGYTYQLNSCPTFNTTNLDYDASLGILREITTDAQAKTLLAVYPDVIKMILDGRESEIDVKKLRNIKEYRLNVYIREIRNKFQYLSIMQENKQYDLTASECKELIRKFSTNEEVNSHLDKEPYECLIQLLGRDFQYNDKIILEQHEDLRFSTSRVESLIYYILKLNEDDSNTCMGANVMAAYTKAVASELYDQIKSVSIDSDKFYYDETNKRIALSETYNSECMVADFVKGKLNGNKWNIDWKKYQDVDSFKLTVTQLNALKNVCEHEISLLVGYAGSGKSSTTKAILQMADENNLSYKIVAPSAKAAIRVKEITGRNASTIHKLCLTQEEVFCDMLIVDEVSMCDLPTFCMLIKSLTNEHCHILLIGDDFQLPSVGVGKIFHDIIESKIVAETKLTEIFRYSDKGTAYVATNIREGKQFLKGYDTQALSDNYKFIQTDDVKDVVVNEYKQLLKTYQPEDIMVLSPYNVKDEGAYVLANEIQEIINPLRPYMKQLTVSKSGVKINFREGDNVLCTKNDYDATPYDEMIDHPIAVFNGQTGKVIKVEDDFIVVNFDGDEVVYSKNKLNELLLSAAYSVHKSQGSEAKAVISITSPSHKRMLNKNLCYVASTRSKEKHIEIGDIQTMNNAIGIDVNETRQTFLKELLVK